MSCDSLWLFLYRALKRISAHAAELRFFLTLDCCFCCAGETTYICMPFSSPSQGCLHSFSWCDMDMSLFCSFPFPGGLGVCCLRIITKDYFKSSFSICLLIFCMQINSIVVEEDKTELNMCVCVCLFTGVFWVKCVCKWMCVNVWTCTVCLSVCCFQRSWHKKKKPFTKVNSEPIHLNMVRQHSFSICSFLFISHSLPPLLPQT